VNNFVQDIKNYRKNYRGSIQTATIAMERRIILREASNSTMTPRKIKEAVESAASLRTVQRLIKKCAYLSRRRLKKKNRFDSKALRKSPLFCKKPYGVTRAME
jgi:hypothetical protein